MYPEDDSGRVVNVLKHAFGEELSDQTSARGSDGLTDGDLALADAGSRKKEIG